MMSSTSPLDVAEESSELHRDTKSFDLSVNYMIGEADRLIGDAIAHEDAGQIASALSIAEEARQYAFASGNVDALVRAEFALSRYYHLTNQIDKAIALQISSAQRVKDCKDKVIASRIFALLGSNLVNNGEIGRGFDIHMEALNIALPFGPQALWLPTIQLGYSRLVCGDIEGAIDLYHECFELLDKIGPDHPDRHFRFCTLCNTYSAAIISQAFIGSGASHENTIKEIERTEALLSETLKIAEEHVPRFVPEFLVQIATCHLILKKAIPLDELEAVVAFIPLLNQRGCDCYTNVLQFAEAVCSRSGNWEMALRILKEFEPANTKEFVNWRLYWLKTAALVWDAAGRSDEAIGCYKSYIAEQETLQRRSLDFQIAFAGRLGDFERARMAAKLAQEKANKLSLRNKALMSERRMLEISAKTDALTGLGNRRMLQDEIDRIEAEGHAADRMVAIIDLDHFKMINDRFSHQIGDKVLIRLAEILKHTIRPTDLVVRWGGEEFVVLFSGLLTIDRLERLRLAIQNANWSEIADGLSVTASIGAAHWHAPGNFDDTLKVADERLYRAKNEGRNRSVVD